MTLSDYISLKHKSIHLETNKLYILKFDKYIIEISKELLFNLTDMINKDTITELLNDTYIKDLLSHIYRIIYRIQYPYKFMVIHSEKLEIKDNIFTEIRIEFETYKPNNKRTEYIRKDKIRIKLIYI